MYEYVNNGNLEQWLHGAMRQHGNLTWEARMKVLLGTAKALVSYTSVLEACPRDSFFFIAHFSISQVGLSA